MAKKIDPKAKAKRQKIMAGAGAVLLLAILAIQVPRTMKMLDSSAPAEAPPAAPAPGTDPSVLPTPGTAGAATAPVPSGASLVDSDTPPAPEAGQLVSFSRFASKDPFVEQIDDDGPSGSGGESSGGGSAEGGIVGGEEGSTAPGAAGSAVIAVNGVEETVSVKGQFPAGEPVFVLVSLTGSEAKIAIAGGSLASGAPTVTLRLGKPLTLVNTADGVRYELKLVKTG